MAGVLNYVNNTADMTKIDRDVDVLAAYYHNLGFLTATVGRRNCSMTTAASGSR